MAEDVRVTNWPNSNGSEAAAAIRLWETLGSFEGGPTTIDGHLLLFRRCRAAVMGHSDPNDGGSSGGRSRTSTSQSGFY